MIERNVVVGAFQCNCRILVCDRTRQAALVDPGDDPQRILAEIRKIEGELGGPIQVRFLLHTHAHLDHIGGTRSVKEANPSATISLHRDDDDLYRNLRMQGQLFGMSFDEPIPVERFLEDEEEIRIGELKLNVIHTPGHSPGGVCFRLHEDSQAGARETVFSGDTLFQGSIGRTDLWGGDTEILLSSIRRRLFTLDEDTRVCPGHGPESRIGIEKRGNPFFQ